MWDGGSEAPTTIRELKMRLAVLIASLFVACESAACNGDATPGPRNLNPIDTAPPKFVKQVPNGKLYTVGPEGDKKDLIHVWGSPYENGYAVGQLMGPKVTRFITEVYDYLEGQIVHNVANATWCAQFPTRCEGLKEVMKMGLEAALNLSYHQTAPYIQPYVMEEIQGLADSTGVSVTDIRDVHWLGEITRGACSMFGAKDSATQSRGGKLLQLRALDWDVDGPFRNFATIVVYHPNPGNGNAWANLGFTGWMAAITGFSEQQIGMSEIGVSFPDESFGAETYLAKGYPFAFLIRDVIQFDSTLSAATKRITEATRTCDLLLGVGDGKSNDFAGYQYSPKVANVFKPENPAVWTYNATWHPPINDVVYWGMDWLCPNDNTMLSHQLQKYHGQLTPEITISDITSYVRTGDVHIAVYDHSAMAMYVATARPDGSSGPLEAYQRQFTKLDMAALFAEPRPQGIRGLAQANCIQIGGECCAAPGGDVHKCPVRTSDCEPIASCCCD